MLAPAAPGLPHGPRPGQPTLHLFGSPRLLNGQGEDIDLGRGHLARKLLLFLAIQGETGAIIERIHAAVWARLDVEDEALAEDDDAQARAVGAAHKAVGRLRIALARHLPPEAPAITCRGGVFRLNPDAVWTDTAAVTACLAEARRLPDAAALPLLRAVLAHYTAPLAAEVPASWFDPVWLDQERAHYAEEARRATLWAAAILARGGDYAGAVAAYGRLRALFIVDDEAAERELICQALRGEPGLVERSYEEHAAAMAKMGMQPRQLTRHLFKQLTVGALTPEHRQQVMTARQH
jgi:DNA-binding SARP family transcriptional activator